MSSNTDTNSWSTTEERVNAARGYKAALHNPNVSEEARQRARERLHEIGGDEAEKELYSGDDKNKDTTRVAAGLKAAQQNPNVTGEGKQRASERLGEIESHGPQN